MIVTEDTLIKGTPIHKLCAVDGAPFQRIKKWCEDKIEEKEKITDTIGRCISMSKSTKESALEVQVGGGHYKDMKIQVIDFCHVNNIPFAEGSAIKYLCRWRKKNGVEDLKKARHLIDMLIELEESKQ